MRPYVMEKGRGIFTVHQKKLVLVSCDANINVDGHLVVALKPGGCFFSKNHDSSHLFECAQRTKKVEKAPNCQVEWGDETITPFPLERGKGQVFSAGLKWPIILSCNQPRIAAPGYRTLRLMPGSCQAFVDGDQKVLFECQ